MTLRVIRAALTGFLLVAAGVLSFGALRHQALTAGIIHRALVFVSAHTLAGVWALCPDVLAAVGIVGIRIDRRDPRAWVALILGLGMTLTFQVWSHPWPWLLRGVPAVAGAMAVWIMEVPWNRSTDPVPTPLHRWLRSWDQPDQDPTPVAPDSPTYNEPGPNVVPVPEVRPRPTQDAARQRRLAALGRPFTPDDHEQVRIWVDQGRTNKAAMARELGLHKRGQLELGRYVNQYRDQLVQVGHPNGQGPGSAS